MSDDLAPRPGITLADNQRLDWLRLIRSENIGPATFIELIKRFGTASNALEALPDIVKKARGHKIKIASRETVERELDQIYGLGGRTVCLGEPDYPKALRAADAPPPVLTVRGNSDILHRDIIAFVGSRNASLAGCKFTQSLAKEVGAAGYATSSGLARGIDAAAHQATLDTGTIAVFAGGIDHIYPHQNEKLAHQIVEHGGLLVSEMPFGWKPRAQDFPRRNRIVAGLALGLVVVEAAKRSGSLISARLANEMGRLVFAVPGSPLDPRSEGANLLIKQGAQLVSEAQDIVQAISPLTGAHQQASYSLEEDGEYSSDDPPSDDDRAALLNALGPTPTNIDELVRFTGIELGKLQFMLLELDLAGKLERQSGNRVSLNLSD